MKKDVTIYHKISRILVGVVFLVLLAAGGCSNVLMKSPAAPEAAGPGGGVKVTLRLFTGSARTVMPEMDLLTWHITAEQGTDNIEATGTYPTYTLELPTVGRWIFTVKGINPTGDEIFTGDVTQEIGGGSSVTISIPLSPGSAMTAGTGQINLTLKVPDTVGTVMYKLDGESGFTDLSLTNGSCILNKTGVSAGTHTLSLYFLDERGTTLYMCTEAVNVWKGMTSSQWINTGNIGYITGNGEFELTDVIIDAFLNTMGSVVYVNDSVAVNAPATGSIFAPVNSVSKAVDILRKANPGGNYNGTIMVSGATTIDQEIEVLSGETLTVKGTEAGASIKNTSGRVFNITGGSVTLGDGITLTGTVTGENARGGAVYVTGGNFTMESGSTIADSSVQGTSASGGGVYVMNGTFIMEDGSKITGSSATVSGGGVAVSTGGTFTMRGGTIDGTGANSNAESGGGVEIYDAIFTMEGGTITGNNATYGGGVRVDSGEFTMKDGTISDNNATKLGGGVCVIDGSFTMSDTATIQGNTATTHGGGVYVNGGNFEMIGGTIGGTDAGSANSAQYGGGVYVNGGEFEMTGTAILQGNTATTHGGGVHILSGGTFTMNGGTIVGTAENTANYGGGVFVSGGEFIMNDGSISGNTVTQSGGGVFVNAGNFTMKGGTIGGTTANTATQNGGGVFVQAGTFNMTGTAVIQGNEATGGSSHACGGGVYVNGGEFTMTGTTIIQDNKANSTNGHACGGGVYVNGTGKFDMGDTATIQGNNASTTATNSAAGGGGVYVNGGTFTMTGTAKIQGNTTTSANPYTKPSGGGGVFVIAGGTFTMSGGTIGSSTDANEADLGGGVYVGVNTGTGEKGSFTMGGGTITGNTATQNGGGVYVNSLTFTVTGTPSINNNTANSSANNVHLISKMTITIGEDGLAGGEIGVTAENVPSGSAVPITDEDVTGADGIFTSDNPDYSIVKYNGAVYLSDTETVYVANSGTETFGTFADALSAVKSLGGTITLLKNIEGTNSVFEDDFSKPQPITFSSDDETRSFILDLNGKTINRELSTPTTDGSVIKIEGGALTIKDSSATNSDGTGGTGTITGGNTKGGGGGIHITSNSIGNVPGSLILESGSIRDNTADGSNGGGIYIYSDCAFTMKGGSIDGNIVSSATSNYGGGVFVYGTFTMENGIITKNSSEQGNGGGVNIGTDGAFTMKGGTISDNDAGVTGGGVNLGAYGASGATMTLEGGTISDNTATVNGGGVGVSVGTFTMNGGTIGGTGLNTANIGGGVYVDGVNSNFIMTGGTISGNTAAQKGGGVYVSSTGNFTLGSSSAAAASSPVVSGNTKNGNSPNNVYLDDTILLIEGELKKSKESGNIGISMATPGEFTLDWSKSGLTDSTFFFSDDTKRTVALSGSELSLNLVFVQGGSCELNSQSVTLSDFWISPYEVTQEEFVSVMTRNANGITPDFNHKDTSLESGEVQERRPADTVRWFEAIVYCNLLSIKEGLNPCYTINGSTDPAEWGERPDSNVHDNYYDWNSVTCNFDANGYRLPTEAEWEYAARGGNPGDISWNYDYSGSDTIGNVAWYDKNSTNKTHEVGKKQANALGLYDMSGNVWEWCWNRKSDDYPGSGENPTGSGEDTSGGSRQLRGGCYNSDINNSKISSRDSNFPTGQGSNYGFRVVRSIR